LENLGITIGERGFYLDLKTNELIEGVVYAVFRESDQSIWITLEIGDRRERKTIKIR
jgi:hypothetical protein